MPINTAVSSSDVSTPTTSILKQVAQNQRKENQDFKRDEAYLIGAPVRPVSGAATAGVIYKIASGDLIYCTVAGTTGASDPAISYAGPVVDGTATFYFTGKKTNVAAGVDVPTISVSSAIGALTERRITLTGETKISYPFGYLTDYASVAVKLVAWNDLTALDNGYGANGNQPSNLYYEFMSDAPTLAVSVYNVLGERMHVKVDGNYIEESPTPFVAGNPSYYFITWNGIQKMRRYTIEGHGSLTFRGLCALAGDVITATPLVNKTALIWFGDSYGNTETPQVTNGAINTRVSGLAMQVGKLIGTDYTMLANIGGSGYITLGNSSRPNIPSVVGITNFPLAQNYGSVVIYLAGINDSTLEKSAIATAATATWQAGMAKYPNATHIVVGCELANRDLDGFTIGTDTALKNAAGSLGLKYISMAQDPNGAWILGTGKVGAVSGTGNSNIYTSTDGTHPSPIGRDYLARRIASEVNSYLDSIGL